MLYYLKWLMPEIIFVIATTLITIGFFALAGWPYGLIFGGGVLLVVAALTENNLRSEQE